MRFILKFGNLGRIIREEPCATANNKSFEIKNIKTINFISREDFGAIGFYSFWTKVKNHLLFFQTSKYLKSILSLLYHHSPRQLLNIPIIEHGVQVNPKAFKCVHKYEISI